MLILACLAFVCIAMWRTSLELFEMWSFDGYRHGYFVPFISLYFLWQQRARLAEDQWRPQATGAFCLTAALLAWAISGVALIQVLEQLCFIGVIGCTVWALFGFQALKKVLFPIGFLVFGVPLGVELIPILMDKTATASVSVLRFLGYPVYRDGMLLVLPSGDFEVAEACSGFYYLYTGVALSTLIAYLHLEGQLARVLFVVVSALAFVLLNWARVVIVIIVASWSDMTLFISADHILFGTVLFAIVLVLQLWIATKIAARRSQHPSDG